MEKHRSFVVCQEIIASTPFLSFGTVKTTVSEWISASGQATEPNSEQRLEAENQVEPDLSNGA